MRTRRSYRGVELTFLRILHVAHPCIFFRTRPVLGYREGSRCEGDRNFEFIVHGDAPATGSGGVWGSDSEEVILLIYGREVVMMKGWMDGVWMRMRCRST